MTAAADYHGQDLRGRSFEGEDLDSVNFAGTDLRGADFTNASLVEANFVNAQLGVRPLSAVLALLAAMAISVVAGLAVGFLAEATREQATSSDWRDMLAAALLTAVIVTFLGVTFLKGVSKAIRVFFVFVAIVIAIDFATVFILAGEVRFRRALPLIALLVLFIPAATAGILGRIVGGTFGGWAIGIVAVMGGVAAGRAQGGIAAIVVSMLLVLISKRALKNDARDAPMRYLAHRIATHRGTRFDGADLTRADFTETELRHSDMSSAILQDTIWEPGQIPYVPDPLA